MLDDMTGTSVGPFTYAIPLEGMYALGDTLGGGFSRFNTSPTVPTWGIGIVSIVYGSPCATPGALYSNTQGSTGLMDSVYVCIYNGGSPQWRSIKPCANRSTVADFYCQPRHDF